MRSGKLERITATNSLPGGCDASPGLRCAPICKLTVEVPHAKEIVRLDINQDASDEADHVKVVLKDVKIKDCRVNGPRVELVGTRTATIRLRRRGRFWEYRHGRVPISLG